MTTDLPATQAHYEELRDRAVTLRRQGLSRRRIRDHLKISNNDLLNRLLRGEPPPDWTRRPNAKDAQRTRARALRRAGLTYDEIELELGVSKGSISLWVRDLPKPPPRRDRQEQARLAATKRWEHEAALRETERRRTTAAAHDEIGELTDRELFLVGVGLYWSEGAKSKPYRRREEVIFCNSDPGMIRTYLAWLDLLKVAPEQRQFRLMIHESADVPAAERYWADLVGVEVSGLEKTTLKRHNPKTVRKNVGASYRGCLTIRIRKGAGLYRRIEGWWCGIVEASTERVEGSTHPS